MSETQSSSAKETADYSNGQEKETRKRSPSYIAYGVREGKDGKAYFNQVGAAFANKDGEGHNLQLEALPLDGRIVLRTPKERLQAMKEGQSSEASEQAQTKGGHSR